MKTSLLMPENELIILRKAFQPVDYFFSLKMVELNGEYIDNRELFIVSLLLSGSLSEHGNICLDIRDHHNLNALLSEILEEHTEKETLPDFLLNENTIEKVAACRVTGTPGEYKPLILENGRLYLHKYWTFEEKIISGLKKLAIAKKSDIDIKLITEGLNRFFPISKLSERTEDYQRVAAFCSAVNRLSIITGGPGTGKTTVMAAVLLLLQEQALKKTGKPLKISLCAPTGKAAARLSEAVYEEVNKLNIDSSLKSSIPEKSLTLHKLLGPIYLSPNFKHNGRNPIDSDVIVVDEASMAPAALMARLLDSLRENSKLILLGDKDQLASVEAGSVFADICDSAKGDNATMNLFSSEFAELYKKTIRKTLLQTTDKATLLSDNIVELDRSHRFAPYRGIGKLKQAVNAGSCEAAFESLLNDPTGETTLDKLPETKQEMHYKLKTFISNLKVGSSHSPFLSYLDSEDIDTAFDMFNSFRVLCSNKNGICGANDVNLYITNLIREYKNIPSNEHYFKGLPLLITKNYPPLDLFNGDIGLCWKHPVNPNMTALFFPDTYARGKYKILVPSQLPEHETVFAMTIHKSQGSGFEKALILLSGKEDSNLLTRELIYTAITRAKKYAVIWTSESSFINAVSKSTLRSSGISSKLK